MSHPLVSAFLALGLNASNAPAGALCLCPRCQAVLTLPPGGVSCPQCFWTAKGESWEVAKLAASAAPKGRTSNQGLPLWSVAEILSHVPDPSDEVWSEGVLSAGAPAAIIGAPGVGKSRLALQAAIHSILGKPFLGWRTNAPGHKWLFLQTENSIRRLKADLEKMTCGLPPDELELVQASLSILNVGAMEFASICMVEGQVIRERILATLEALDPTVVVIDPLRDAAHGDLNKDEFMAEACQAIGQVIRRSNPRRVPLIVHHGRTGSSEASKVFGDDAASFGRNSKVLYGWLRSQINVAPAGVNHPDTVIIGCGKCSDGPRWQPRAARLDPGTMTYRVLSPSEFDLSQWESGMGKGGGGATQRVTPEEVRAVLVEHGKPIMELVKSKGGLNELLRSRFGIGRNAASDAIKAAVRAGRVQYLGSLDSPDKKFVPSPDRGRHAEK